MSAALLDLARMSHQVWEFLSRQSAEHLAAFVDGRYRLAFVVVDDHARIREPAVITVTDRPSADALQQDGTVPGPSSAGESALSVPVTYGAGGDPSTPEPTPRSEAPPSPERVPAATRTRKKSAPAAASTAAQPEPSAIAEALRGMDSLNAGAAYLDSLRLTISALVAVGTELGAPMPAKPRKADAIKMVLNQAIGARRKFAGLSSW